MEIEALQMTPVKMQAESHLGEDEPAQTVPVFGEYLKNALGEVNSLQKESDNMSKALAAGQVEDISQVVIAAEKADIALQLTLAVRNKAVEAYQEIMRMQV
ncbi:MAG: flagellar hook-basal body complex protein FliE [Anaerovibrio sp.]|nr:flagellar hook-basal body complex protein FliE [Anaerovibrio sp.]